ncbi:30S ribosomal protein S1 [candidate division KSB1 bacterium]|nr:30S ribosomal protein S1 [candidate division KSB1 bacterium]
MQPVAEEILTSEQPQNPNKGGDEKFVKLEDLKDDFEYTADEYDEMVKLYEGTLTDFVEGEVIVGKVLAINDKEVAIDIGFKSEGTVPIDEFPNLSELKIGDDIEVLLDNIEDKEGQLVLSKKKADFMHTWDKVVKAHENGDVMQGKCVRRIKGGIVVDLMGIDAFLPGSQIDVKPIRDFDAFIGKMMDFKVVKVNNLRKNIVVSHRVLVEAELVEQRQKILEELAKGQVLEGTVKNITDFGVFIDLGGADGLLHINDLSWGRVSHPSEIVSLDEKIKVMVLDFNEAKDRISLGLKQLQPHPWANVADKYPIGAVVKGKVVNISDYGAFVELEKGVEGLIHISEMSWTQHIKHPSKILAVGETVETKILSIDTEEKKISLGLKQLEPDPWDMLEVKYPVGSRHTGKVRNLTNFGAFVELEEGIDGLVHISDLSWTKKIRHPGEVVKKGATIDVVVLDVDRENRRISLGYKQTSDNPWDTFAGQYAVGTVVTGKIIRLIEKGVITEINDEVDGFVPLSHLAQKVTRPSDAYKVGDDLELCVIEFNKENKKIVCSEKVEHAQSLIQQKESGVATEPLVSEEDLDVDFEEEVDTKKKSKAADKAAKAEPVAAEPVEIAQPEAAEAPAEVEAPIAEAPAAEQEAETPVEVEAAEAEEAPATEDKPKKEAKKTTKTTAKKKTTKTKKADDAVADEEKADAKAEDETEETAE